RRAVAKEPADLLDTRRMMAQAAVLHAVRRLARKFIQPFTQGTVGYATEGGPSPRPSPHSFVVGRGRRGPCTGAGSPGDCSPTYGPLCKLTGMVVSELALHPR